MGSNTLAAGLQLQPACDLAGCAPSDQAVQHAGVQDEFRVHTVLLGGGGPVAELAAVAGQLAVDPRGSGRSGVRCPVHLPRVHA